MNKHIIIGTAGHIDHGKTALIKALTGLDTDRLKEEKERGITIDIGFAYWQDRVTIIDVPGHEKFIRNMVAGVSTIDFFLLVIAADDGIMPQTIEHLDILNFFNIREGIVVINKIDLVEQSWLELQQQEIQNLLREYRLENLPVIAVSALKNINIDLLRQVIEDKIAAIGQKQSLRPFRLPVDRSFQIKGFGTVVTGTVLSGGLQKGQEAEVYPAGQIVRVRGLQVHTRDTDRIEMSERAAVNISDLGKDEIFRGDVLARPGTMLPVIEFSGIMHTVSQIPLQIKNRARVHVYSGTAERTGNLLWYDDSRYLQPAQSYHVYIKLDGAIAAAPGDAFLIRLPSPVITLAGGKILEINPARPASPENNRAEYFEIMSGNDMSARIGRIISDQGFIPVSRQFLQVKLFEQADIIDEQLARLADEQLLRLITIKGSAHYIHAVHFNSLCAEIVDHLANYHRQNPLKPGLNLQELKTAMEKEWLPEEVYDAALQHLEKDVRLRHSQNAYHLASFKIRIDRDLDQAVKSILDKLNEAGFSPPGLPELAALLQMSVDETRVVIRSLVEQKLVIPVTPALFLHHSVHQKLIRFLRDYFSTHISMPVADLKGFIATTRKYAIPIFEYLDASGFTIRSGDVRKKGPAL